MCIRMHLYSSLVLCLLTGCGTQGADGADASAIPVLTRPATADECPTGGTHIGIGSASFNACNGSPGAPGSNGIDGSAGPIGPKGDPGVDTTPITIVQFCSGSTVYPSVFAEIGFCISNQIYAVYSEHDGFMTYVPPGAYVSHAHGSNCTFTVGPNCAISH